MRPCPLGFKEARKLFEGVYGPAEVLKVIIKSGGNWIKLDVPKEDALPQPEYQKTAESRKPGRPRNTRSQD